MSISHQPSKKRLITLTVVLYAILPGNITSKVYATLAPYSWHLINRYDAVTAVTFPYKLTQINSKTMNDVFTDQYSHTAESRQCSVQVHWHRFKNTPQVTTR